MYLELAIISFFFLISLISVLPHILQFQIAEYLIYRYNAMVLDSSLGHMFFPRLKMPAKSMRNLLIFGFVGIVLLGSSIGIYLYTNDIAVTLVLSITLFFFAKFAVVLGVLLTTPIAWVMRSRRILIAKRQINNSKVKIIGITGSYGKSSVKEILHRILSVRYLTAKTRSNHNTDVGIAIEAGLQITPHTQYFIAEMGAYRKGDIIRLCKMYEPEIGVVTGIGNQHVSLFGSPEKIKETKLEMISGVNKGPVYINVDWPGALEYLNEKKLLTDKVVTYGENPKAGVWITGVRIQNGLTLFTLEYKGRYERYTIKLLGRHNIVNTVPAILIAKQLGMTYQEIYKALSEIEPVLGKLSIHKTQLGMRILNDGYNSNLNGFLAGLNVLRDMRENEKYVSTLGLFELGKDKVKAYEEILAKAKGYNIKILTTDKDMVLDKFKDVVKYFINEKEMLNEVKRLESNRCAFLLEGRHSYTYTNSLGITKAY